MAVTRWGKRVEKKKVDISWTVKERQKITVIRPTPISRVRDLLRMT